MTWKEAQNKEGRIYYYNSETKQSSWDKPKELYNRLDELLEQSPWKKYFSKENKKYYYYNTETKQTTWDFPVKDEGLKNTGQLSVPAAEAKTTSTPESQESHSETTPGSASAVINADKTSSTIPYDKIFSIDTKLINPQGLIAVSAKQDSNLQKSKFINLLEDNGVDNSWSFQKVMENFITDPRYWLIDDTLAKKSIFEEYLLEKSRREFLKVSNSKDKFQSDFQKLIRSHSKDIKYYTRWKTFKHAVNDEPIYNHSILSENEKKTLFLNYVSALREQHNKEEETFKRQAISEFEEYFESTLKAQLTAESNWEDLLSLITRDERVKQNKNFKRLNKLDILKIYSKHLDLLEKDLKARLKTLEQKNRQSDRIARDSFKAFLNDMKKDNLITINTTFKEIYPFIKNEELFKNLLGRIGSTPLELFRDSIEEQNILLRAQKDIVFNYLVEKNFNILTNSRSAFFKLLEENQDFSSINSASNNDDKKFLQEHKDMIYEMLAAQSLNELKKTKRSVEIKFEDRKSSFKRHLADLIKARFMRGDSSIAKTKSLSEISWDKIKGDVAKESFAQQFLSFIQQNYKYIFDTEFAKLLNYDYFINTTKGQGHASLEPSKLASSTSAQDVEPHYNEVAQRLFEQLLVRIKEELLAAESLAGQRAESSMDLDY